MLRNFPDERRSHLFRGGSLKSGMAKQRFKSTDCVTNQGPSLSLDEDADYLYYLFTDCKSGIVFGLP